MEKVISNKIAAVNAAVAAEVRAEFARQQGKSIAEVARSLGMRRSTLSQHINGKSAALSPGELLAISEYLDVALDTFFSPASSHSTSGVGQS